MQPFGGRMGRPGLGIIKGTEKGTDLSDGQGVQRPGRRKDVGRGRHQGIRPTRLEDDGDLSARQEVGFWMGRNGAHDLRSAGSRGPAKASHEHVKKSLVPPPWWRSGPESY